MINSHSIIINQIINVNRNYSITLRQLKQSVVVLCLLRNISIVGLSLTSDVSLVSVFIQGFNNAWSDHVECMKIKYVHIIQLNHVEPMYAFKLSKITYLFSAQHFISNTL